MTDLVSNTMMKIVDSGIVGHIFEMGSPYRSMKSQVSFEF